MRVREKSSGKPAGQDKIRDWGKMGTFLLVPINIETMIFRLTLFKMQRAAITLERNLVRGLGQLERKTKQTDNPFGSGRRMYTLPGCDLIFWKPPNRAPCLGLCGTGYTEAGGHQPRSRACTCWKKHPPTWTRRGRSPGNSPGPPLPPPP